MFRELIDHIHGLPYPKPYLGDDEVQYGYIRMISEMSYWPQEHGIKFDRERRM